MSNPTDPRDVSTIVAERDALKATLADSRAAEEVTGRRPWKAITMKAPDMIQPENTFGTGGAHFALIFTTKEDARDQAENMRHWHKIDGNDHLAIKVSRRAIRVDCTKLIVWIVTERHRSAEEVTRA